MLIPFVLLLSIAILFIAAGIFCAVTWLAVTWLDGEGRRVGLISLVLFFVAGISIFTIYINRRTEIDKTTVSYHQIELMELPDGTTRQVSITPRGEGAVVIHIDNVERGIQPNGSILKRYKLKSKHVDYHDGSVFLYEVINPSDPNYEEMLEELKETSPVKILHSVTGAT